MSAVAQLITGAFASVGGKSCKSSIVERSKLCHIDARSRYSHSSIDKDYDVQLSEVLGRGLNGAVTLGVNKFTHQRRAVKVFDKQKMAKEKHDSFLRSEVNIYLQVDHPHIARLLHVYEEEHRLSLVMELCEGNELFYRLSENKVFSEQEAASATYQMCLAISYLHRNHIVHRDIKLENWLYESKADNAKLKLIDFGFATFFDEQSFLSKTCGSIAYIAPEVLEKRYRNECDMWSLGVLVFSLLGGSQPFSSKDPEEMKRKIMQCKYGFRRDKWEHTSECARHFITKLLVASPANRMSASESLEHPWITKVDREARATSQNTSQSSASTALLEDLRRYASGSHFKHLALSIMAHHLSSSELEEIQEAFLALDVDKKGAITFQELQAAMMKSQLSVSEEELKCIFDVVNLTHDKEIHYSEFIAAVLETRLHMDNNSRYTTLLRETFDQMDISHTGKITEKGLRKVIGGNKFENTNIRSLMSECQGCTSKSGITFEKFSQHLQTSESMSTACPSNWSIPSRGSSCELERTFSLRSRESMRPDSGSLGSELEQTLSWRSRQMIRPESGSLGDIQRFDAAKSSSMSQDEGCACTREDDEQEVEINFGRAITRSSISSATIDDRRRCIVEL